MAETEPLNPYQAPESSPDEPNFPPGPRFRFRVIPAFIVGLYGGMALLGAFASPVLSLIMFLLNPDARRPGPQAVIAVTLGLLVFAVSGGAGLAASRAFMRGRWKVAILLTLAMSALYGLLVGAIQLLGAMGFRI